MYPWRLCLILAVSRQRPLIPGCPSAAVCCISAAESWVPVLSALLLESLGPNDSWLSANPSGARDFFLLGALSCGSWKMPGEPPSGKYPVSLGAQLLLLPREWPSPILPHLGFGFPGDPYWWAPRPCIGHFRSSAFIFMFRFLQGASQQLVRHPVRKFLSNKVSYSSLL